MELHPDIIRAHILSRLDGPSLAAASCASSDLHHLSSDDALWRELCAATWPSVAGEPSLARLIRQFPHGHRSFFSDAFPGLDLDTAVALPPLDTHSSGLISAVDIFYKGNPILSKVTETETTSEWFKNSPFSVELELVEDSVPIAAAAGELEESLRVRWVLVDPAHRRAATVCSWRAVMAERHWLSGDVQLRFSTVMVGPTGEKVQCAVVVSAACGCVRGVGLHVEDLEGRHLSGQDSVGVLVNALRRGKRTATPESKERDRFQHMMEQRRDFKEARQRRERNIDFLFIITAVSIFASFCSFLLFSA